MEMSLSTCPFAPAFVAIWQALAHSETHDTWFTWGHAANMLLEYGFPCWFITCHFWVQPLEACLALLHSLDTFCNVLLHVTHASTWVQVALQPRRRFTSAVTG